MSLPIRGYRQFSRHFVINYFPSSSLCTIYSNNGVHKFPEKCKMSVGFLPDDIYVKDLCLM